MNRKEAIEQIVKNYNAGEKPNFKYNKAYSQPHGNSVFTRPAGNDKEFLAVSCESQLSYLATLSNVKGIITNYDHYIVEGDRVKI